MVGAQHALGGFPTAGALDPWQFANLEQIVSTQIGTSQEVGDSFYAEQQVFAGVRRTTSTVRAGLGYPIHRVSAAPTAPAAAIPSVARIARRPLLTLLMASSLSSRL